MAIELSKGNNISLTKEAPAVTKFHFGLGWDARATEGQEFDLDAVAIMVNTEGKARSDKDLLFYGNLKSACESVVLSGDNRTGEGDGDDESLTINLETVPADVEKIIIAVTIHEAETRGQNFGQVSNASIRVANAATVTEDIASYDLQEDYSSQNALIFGELYKRNDEWKFRALGDGFSGGMKQLVETYGLTV